MFDEPATLHHGDTVGNLGHHSEIVRNEQHRHVPRGLDLADQRQNLRLGSHVERGGGLVGDEHIGLEYERHCNHRALTLSAGDLMRISVVHPLGLGKMHGGKHLEYAPAPRLARDRLVDLDRLIDLPADREHRVERRHRLLEDHRDAAATQCPEPLGCSREQVFAIVEDPSCAWFHVP